MSASFDSDGDGGDVFIKVPYSSGTNSDIIPVDGMWWTPYDSRVKCGQIPDLCERIINVQRDNTLSTGVGRMQVMPRRNAEQDTFLDNGIGDTVRKAKAKFGKAPFIDAYKKALNTSREINDRRKKCLEEEVRLRSVLRAGEDC